jgi:hypothetical protein
MVGLVNYAKDPHSVELRELPVPGIGDEDVLFKVEICINIPASRVGQSITPSSWATNLLVMLQRPATA